MTKKDYILIAGAIGRTKTVSSMDKNFVRRTAKRAALQLLITDLATTLKHENPLFDEDKFRQACGY